MKPVLCAWWGVCVALLVLQSQARPSPGSDSESWRPLVPGHRVNRPLFRDDEGPRESKSKEEVKEKEAPSTERSREERSSEGRASSTSPTPIGESLKMVTKQLLQSPEATDMVATDIRTPPKIKTQHVVTEEFVPLGKGEAIPLDPDNTHTYQVTNTQHVKVSTAESTPASGISTWILLNGSEQSTQASQKKQPTKPLSVLSTQVPPKKKQPKPSQEIFKPTHEALKNNSQKVENKQAAIITKVDNPKKTVNQEPLVKIPAVMLQDAKFKNKTPVIVGKVPSSASTKNKSEVVSTFKKGNATITPVNLGKVEALAPQSVRRKVTVVPTSSTPVPTTTAQTVKPPYQYELVPTTSVVVHTDIVEAETTEEVGTTELPTTTTKRTRKPGTKKKKKNKNRRRRPAKKPEGVVESKVTEENNSTRIAPNGSRPLSTRIYNYLSREIMPSVGVGLVGLVLTAGLAGLLLYPFGGTVAARRTYEKTPGTSDGHMYYNTYNDYNANGEVDNGQAEETVFGQVLAGMQQSENKYEKYPRPALSSSAAASNPTHYSTQSKYRYDPSHEYGYQSSYQNKDKYSSLSDVSTTVGRNPEGYSTLPDSASLSSKYSPSYSVSGSQYTAPSGSSVITQYGDPKYSSSVGATGYSDTKYSTVDSNSGVGSVQYDSKYSPSLDSTGSSDSTGTKYSTLTGLSVEPQSSKYTSMIGDQSAKYSPSSKYTSLTEDQENKYQSPTYTSITDSQNTKYTSMNDNQSKYISITDSQNGKYSSMSDNSDKYPTSAEYTAYSNPSDIGTQKGSYSSNHKQTGYTDIEYDDTKSLPSISEEDKSDKSQPTFSALHASDDSYSNVDSMSMFSGSYSNEVRHRQGVLAVEHGPRNIKIDRQKRQIDTKQNEVDGSLVDEQTTTSEPITESPSTEKTTEEPKDNSSPSHESTVESTTWSMPKEPESTTKLPPSREHGFFGFLRRLAEMKLRMGLELLRSTTHAVARYLDDVQKRMENVVREMDKKTDRHRRDLFKKMV